ncbi:MAG: hypothetical protein JOY99_11685 [Sphingomonadaceae bacterium]|nr:hypothetical protein [Sphingomonadaceae bacterium]
MRMVRALAVAGVATLALAGAAIAAATQPTHVETVTLPNGMTAHIRYSGNVAPKLVMTPVTVARVAPVAFVDPFAAMDRMFAQMDAQSDAMMREVAAMQARARTMATAPNLAAAQAVPAGSVVRYSFVSTSSGGASCSRSMQVTSYGGSAKPQVVSHQAGDCSRMGLAAPTPVAAPAAPRAPVAPLPVSAPKPPAPPAVPANTI